MSSPLRISLKLLLAIRYITLF